MTREEALEWFKDRKKMNLDDKCQQAEDVAIKSLEQEPCEDAISREDVLLALTGEWTELTDELIHYFITCIKKLPSVNPQAKTGHCKDCKNFEYDSVAKVGGIPLIVAHEICSRWGDGCKTKEDGYCFMFEPQEREE